MPFAEALAVADGALRLNLLPAQLLPAAPLLVSAADATRGPGRGRRRRVAGCADRRAANPFESALRAVLIEAGLTDFEPQLSIPLSAFTVHADLADPRRRIALEAEGFRYHGSRDEFLRDCGRYTEMVSRGWLVLRFTWDNVIFGGPWVVDVIRDAIRLRDPVPASPRSER